MYLGPIVSRFYSDILYVTSKRYQDFPATMVYYFWIQFAFYAKRLHAPNHDAVVWTQIRQTYRHYSDIVTLTIKLLLTCYTCRLKIRFGDTMSFSGFVITVFFLLFYSMRPGDGFDPIFSGGDFEENVIFSRNRISKKSPNFLNIQLQK